VVEGRRQNLEPPRRGPISRIRTPAPTPSRSTTAGTSSSTTRSGHRAAEAKGDRYPLDVALSTDGVTWQRVLTLETEPCKAGYSYPAVIQAADGRVRVSPYAWDRVHVEHVVLDPARL